MAIQFSLWLVVGLLVDFYIRVPTKLGGYSCTICLAEIGTACYSRAIL